MAKRIGVHLGTGLAPGNQAAKKTSGPYRRYAVTFAASPKDVAWTTASGGAKNAIRPVFTFLSSSDGAQTVLMELS